MSSRKIKYPKRSGTAGIDGHFYEIKLLNLALYRSCKKHMKGEIEDFYLATNVDGFGAFDDIFLEININNEWGAAFVQVKHKEKAGSIKAVNLVSDKHDFSLVKFLHGFKEIKEKPHGILAKENKRFFVIYTTHIAAIQTKRVQPDIHLNELKQIISTRISNILTGDSEVSNRSEENDNLFQIAADENLILKLEQSLTDMPEDDKRSLVEEFLNRLVIFANEGKQSEVEKVTKDEMREWEQSLHKNILDNETINTLYSNLFDQVYNWWSNKKRKGKYLSIECSFLKESRSKSIDVPYLNILNELSTKECTKYGLEFSEDAEKNLRTLAIKLAEPLKNDEKSITNIVSSNVLLTCIKLIQSLRAVKYYMLDIVALSPNEFPMESLKYIKLDVLVIKCDTSEYNCSNIGQEIKRKWIEFITEFPKNVIVVTKQRLNEFDWIDDQNNGLVDLAKECQDSLLASKTITIQGEIVSLNNIIIDNDDVKRLFGEDILIKLINDEKIEIGKHLTDKNYNNLHYYVPRRLTNENDSVFYDIKSFKDLTDQIVVVTAEPGMGKSTLISHLSIETKKKHPEIWIVRINLLDHCSEFCKWKEEEKKLDLRETLTFVCNAQVENVEGKFDIQMGPNGDFINHCIQSNDSSISKLCLDLIINSYNNENIIFIFDGFDEVYSEYEVELVGLINNVRSRNVWITSRPNNDIVKALREKFGIPYKLLAISITNQQMYYHNYFEGHIFNNVDNAKILINIKEFLNYLTKFIDKTDSSKAIIDSGMQMVLYLHAAKYFQYKYIYETKLRDQNVITDDHFKSINHFGQKVMDTVGENSIGSDEKQLGNPLYMLFAANHFTNKMKSTDEDLNEKWDVNENSLTYLDSFIDMIFENTWKEKYRMDKTIPSQLKLYKEKKKAFIQINKKLAFYTLFHNDMHYQEIISNSEQLDIELSITKISNGEENTGLIHLIHNNIPKYHHLVFAEYLASKYIADSIGVDTYTKKNNNIVTLLRLLFFKVMYKTHAGVMIFFEKSLSFDRKLQNCLSHDESKKQIYECGFGHSIWHPTYPLLCWDENSKDNYPITFNYIKNSIIANLDRRFFLSLQMYAEQYARKQFHQRTIEFLLNLLRDIDPSTVKNAFSGFSVERCLFIPDSDVMDSNTEILERISKEFMKIEKVNTKSKINNARKWDTKTTALNFLESMIAAMYNKLEEQHTSKIDFIKSKDNLIKCYARLAFYALFHNYANISAILSQSENSKLEINITEIEQDKDNFDLIDRIDEKNIPRFTHLCFAQYFACEYIADGIVYAKESEKENLIKLLVFEVIFNDRYGLKPFLDRYGKPFENLIFPKYKILLYKIYNHLFRHEILSENAILTIGRISKEYPVIFETLKMSIKQNLDKKFFKCLELYLLIKITKMNSSSDLCETKYLVPFLHELRFHRTLKDAVNRSNVKKCFFRHNGSMRDEYDILTRLRLLIDVNADNNLREIVVTYAKEFIMNIFEQNLTQETSNRKDRGDETMKFIHSIRILAFFALFHNNEYFDQVISKSEDSEIKETMKKVELEENYCVVIDGIDNNMPKFTHIFYTQYFACEYILEKIKDGDQNDNRLDMIKLFVSEIVVNDTYGLKPIFENMLYVHNYDTYFLRGVIGNQIYTCLFGGAILQPKNVFIIMEGVKNTCPKLFDILKGSIYSNVDSNFFHCMEMYFEFLNILNTSNPNHLTDLYYCDESFIVSLLDVLSDVESGTLEEAVRGFRLEKCFSEINYEINEDNACILLKSIEFVFVEKTEFLPFKSRDSSNLANLAHYTYHDLMTRKTLIGLKPFINYTKFEHISNETKDNNMELMDILKKLAFIALFHSNEYFSQIVSESEHLEIIETMKRMEQVNNCGLIDEIQNNIPRFTHIFYARYFASEYIAEGLYSEVIVKRQTMIKLFLFEVIAKDTHKLTQFFEIKFSQNTFSNAKNNCANGKYIYTCLFVDVNIQLQNPFLVLGRVKNKYPAIFVMLIFCIKRNLDSFFFKSLEMYFEILLLRNNPEIAEIELDQSRLRAFYYYVERFIESFIDVLISSISTDELRLINWSHTYHDTSSIDRSVSSTSLHQRSVSLFNYRFKVLIATLKNAIGGLRLESCFFRNNDIRDGDEILERIRVEFKFSEWIENGLASHDFPRDLHMNSQLKMSDVYTHGDENWDLFENTMTAVNSFIETIFVQRWNEKHNKRKDEIYEKEMMEFKGCIKKMAFVSLFNGNAYFSIVISESQYSEILTMANIEQRESNCILEYGNIPMFTHLFVAQYFTCEYIVEGIHSNDLVEKKNMINFFVSEVILWNRFGLRDIFEKILIRNHGFREVLTDDENRKEIYDFIFSPYVSRHRCRFVRDAISYKLPKEITTIWLKSLKGNIDRRFFKYLQDIYQDGLDETYTNVVMECVLDIIREMKTDKLEYALENSYMEDIFLSKSKEMLSNQEILKGLDKYRLRVGR